MVSPSPSVIASLGTLSHGDPIEPADIVFAPSLAGDTIEVSLPNFQADGIDPSPYTELGTSGFVITQPVTLDASQRRG